LNSAFGVLTISSGHVLVANIQDHVWSSDSEKLAFIDSSDVIIWDLQRNTAIRAVISVEKLETVDWGKNEFLVISDIEERIYLFDVSNNRFSVFADGNHPLFSPDSETIAFTKDSNLFIKNIDGTQCIMHVENVGSFSWSPDGKSIIIDRIDNNS